MSIILKTAMVFDALCACQLVSQSHNKNQYNKVQNEILDFLKEKSDGSFDGEKFSFSNLCFIISAYTDKAEEMTLDDLKKFFEDIDDVNRTVRSKINNEFLASFIFYTLDRLRERGAKLYCGYIDKLKKLGFEEIWREKILPIEIAQIERTKKQIENYDLSKLLYLLSDLKNKEKIEDVSVYNTLMSHPVSCTLHGNSFLNTVYDYQIEEFLSMISHELMHGFASNKLTKLYIDFMKKNLYLRSTHKTLINDMHSGNEEEFVMAAEYYLLYKAEIMSRKAIFNKYWGRYGGCVPMAMYIFGLMCEEKATITNYNEYLINLFENGCVRAEDVFSYAKTMLPVPNKSDDFFVNLFWRFQRCAMIIREAQMGDGAGFDEKIENITKQKFLMNKSRTVNFVQSKKELSENITRKTLCAGNLIVDAITFPTKKEAFLFRFPYSGSNIGPFPVNYEGETIRNPYFLNLTYPKDKSIQADFSFVCANTRYFITSVCAENVVYIDGQDNAFYAEHGEDIISAVCEAEKIVLIMNENR